MSEADRAEARARRFNEALGARYRVERELATGGTATVFLAQDLKYQRSVAVKVFRPEVAEAMGHERFVREIAFVAQLNHPHIVPLLDSGEAEELLYYVMPAVEGESLRDRMTREGQLSLDDALRIARDVAVALDYAHSRNVVHRDIKPENILVSMGTAVVADFGIAKMLNAGKGNSLTRAGIAVGTVTYMSPEQAAAGPVDGRTDVYALACVLFEMLAGRPPFVGKSTRAVVAAHFTEPMPSLRALRSLPDEIAPAMELVMAKAMAKTPEERHATATEFVDALVEARRTASRERLLMRVTDDAAAGRQRAAKPEPHETLDTITPVGRSATDTASRTAHREATSPTSTSTTTPANAAGAVNGAAGGPGSNTRWLVIGAVVVVAIVVLVLALR